jgi:hypothetical protein
VMDSLRVVLNVFCEMGAAMRAIGAAMRVEVRRRKDIVIDVSVIDDSSSCFLTKYRRGGIGMLCGLKI